jgi:hypothetical protein
MYRNPSLFVLILFTLFLISCGSSEHDEPAVKDTLNTDSLAQLKEKPLPDSLTIIGTNVNFRSDQATKSVIIFQFKQGERCKILVKGKQEQIGEYDDCWYQVESREKTGWVYGAFTNLKSDKTLSSEEVKGTGSIDGTFAGIQSGDYFHFIIRDEGQRDVSFWIWDDYEGSRFFPEEKPEAWEPLIGKKIRVHYKEIEVRLPQSKEATSIQAITKVELR